MIGRIHVLCIELLDKLNMCGKLKIKYTMKCNLRCTYCSVNLPPGERATFEELTNEEWLQRIEQFPIKVRKIIFVGGEPFYRKDIIELVMELLRRRIVVKIITNLTYKRIMQLPKSPYLKLLATYHEGQCPLEHFKKQYAMIKKKYKIILYETGKKEFADSRMFTCYTKEIVPECYRRDFIIAPNGEYFMDLINFYATTGHHPKFLEQYTTTDRKSEYRRYR